MMIAWYSRCGMPFRHRQEKRDKSYPVVMSGNGIQTVLLQIWLTSKKKSQDQTRKISIGS